MTASRHHVDELRKQSANLGNIDSEPDGGRRGGESARKSATFKSVLLSSPHRLHDDSSPNGTKPNHQGRLRNLWPFSSSSIAKSKAELFYASDAVPLVHATIGKPQHSTSFLCSRGTCKLFPSSLTVGSRVQCTFLLVGVQTRSSAHGPEGVPARSCRSLPLAASCLAFALAVHAECLLQDFCERRREPRLHQHLQLD